MAGRKRWSSDAFQAEGEVATPNDVWWKADENALWMILDNDGLRTIRRSIDNAAVLMHPAGHEPRGKEGLSMWDFGMSHMQHACFGAFMFPFRRVP